MTTKIWSPNDWVEVSISGVTNSTWSDVDVSAHVSADATGVILHIMPSSSNTVGLRKNGSTDDYKSQIYAAGGIAHNYMYVGLDSNKIFELYTTSKSALQSSPALTASTINIVGYFEDEAVFFTNRVVKTLSVTDSAQNVDISGDTGGDTAIGVIGHFLPGDPTGDDWNYGVRKDGSTDVPYPMNLAAAQWMRSHFMVGVSGSEIFEVVVTHDFSAEACDAHILGYIKNAWTFNTNLVDFDTAASTGWKTSTFGASQPLGALLVARQDPFGVRTPGGTGYTNSINSQINIPVGPNASNQVDLYWASTSSSNRYRLRAYPKYGAVTIAAPLGTLTFTGMIPTIATDVVISAPSPSALAITGYAAVINTGISIVAPTPVALSITGLTAVIQTGTSITAPLGSLTLTGYDGDVETPVILTPDTTALTITGLVPDVHTGVTITAPLGTLALNGAEPIASGGYAAILNTTEEFTITGLEAEVRTGQAIDPPTGQLVLSGYEPFVRTGVAIFPPVGSLTLTGKVPTILARPRNFYAALNGRTIEEVFVILITMSHPNLEEPIRISNDTKEVLESGVRGVISQGYEWPYVPFQLILPNLEQDSLPRTRAIIDNISREIVEAIDAIDSPPDIRIQIVLSTDTNIVEYDLQGLKLLNATYNAMTVEGEFSVEYFMNEPYPAVRFTPSRFPGLFRGRQLPSGV